MERGHALLTGGFPCQPFSAMGARGGLTDPRGLLFREVCRVLRASRPRAFLLENVANLVFMDEGRTLVTILEELGGCGYVVRWRLVNALSLLPQQRSRVYLVGFRIEGVSTTTTTTTTTTTGRRPFSWPELPVLPTTLEDMIYPEGATEDEEVVTTKANHQHLHRQRQPAVDDDER